MGEEDVVDAVAFAFERVCVEQQLLVHQRLRGTACIGSAADAIPSQEIHRRHALNLILLCHSDQKSPLQRSKQLAKLQKIRRLPFQDAQAGFPDLFDIHLAESFLVQLIAKTLGIESLLLGPVKNHGYGIIGD